MYGAGSALFEEDFLAGLVTEFNGLGALGATDTKRQAAYRACLVKQRAGAKINCPKPVRRGKIICEEVGGQWTNRRCMFPGTGGVIGDAVFVEKPTQATPPAAAAVDSDTKRQAAYRACLLQQKAGQAVPCPKPVRKAKVICESVGGTFVNRKCSFGGPTTPVVTPSKPPEPVVVSEDTKRQAAYRACLIQQKAGQAVSCRKPVRKAKVICESVGGTFANRQCSFPGAAPPAIAPPTTFAPEPGDTKRQAAYRDCLMHQKAGKAVTCRKPVRKAKLICESLGGNWLKRNCFFPPAPMPPQPPQEVVCPDYTTFNPATGKCEYPMLQQAECPEGMLFDPVRNACGTPGYGTAHDQPRDTGPAPCGTGYRARGNECVPAQDCPSGYELKRYGTSRYFQCVYQEQAADVVDQLPDAGGDLYPDEGATDELPQDYDVPPPVGGGGADWGDWGSGGGGGALQPQILPGDEFVSYDEGVDPGAVTMSMEQMAGMFECDPNFGNFLPMDYPDRYGMMNVLAVFCKTPSGAGGGVMDPSSQEPIEYAEMQSMAGMGWMATRLG